jgi:hypothetical protein
MFSLPDGEVITITPLLPEDLEPGLEEEAIRIAVQTDNLAWSPDGSRLAFTSAHGGSGAELYVYSSKEDSLSRLSDLEGQAFRPIWSPDGQHIVVMEARSFGTGAGYDMAGVWQACSDGTCLHRLYEPASGDELPLGWFSTDTLLLYSFNALFEYHNLRAFNIETGAENVLWSNSFTAAALDPESDTVLLVVDDIIAQYVSEVEAGFYFVRPGGEIEGYPLTDMFADKLRAQVDWHVAAGVFLIELSSEFVSLSPDGELELIVPRILNNPDPRPSPDGTRWVWYDGSDIVLNGPEIQLEILFPADSHPVWGPAGDTVLFVYEGQLVVGRFDDLSTTAYGSGLTGGLRWMGW